MVNDDIIIVLCFPFCAYFGAVSCTCAVSALGFLLKRADSSYDDNDVISSVVSTGQIS
jgi:hypothetical protein